MSLGPRGFRAALLVVVAFVAILVCAAGAGAETKVGEGAEPLVEGHPGAQAAMVKASASYEETSGGVTFNLTMGAEPQEGSEAAVIANLLTVPPGGCNIFSLGEGGLSGIALFEVKDEYEEPTSTDFGESGPGGNIEELGPAAKSVSGTTATYSFSSVKLANQGFDCAYIVANDRGGSSIVLFPLKTFVPPPPAPPASTPVSQAPPPPTSSAPAPAPAVLSIGKLNPVSLQAGKSRSVTVKVTDTGGTATSRGTLRVKAPKGVLVKPGRQQLPVLTPGGSCTVTVRVHLTKKAKKKSTVSLTATAPGVTGTGSLVAKRKKG